MVSRVKLHLLKEKKDVQILVYICACTHCHRIVVFVE